MNEYALLKTGEKRRSWNYLNFKTVAPYALFAVAGMS